MATHRSGNQLDLIYTRHCSTNHVLVTPLHTSDPFLLTLNLNMIPDTTHIPAHVTFQHNIRSRSPSRAICYGFIFTSSPKQLSSLDANSATDTFCSSLTSCLDTFCPLSSRPARTTPSTPWLSDVLREHRSKLRAAERVWHKSQNPTDLNLYRSLVSRDATNDYFGNRLVGRLLFRLIRLTIYFIDKKHTVPHSAQCPSNKLNDIKTYRA